MGFLLRKRCFWNIIKLAFVATAYISSAATLASSSNLNFDLSVGYFSQSPVAVAKFPASTYATLLSEDRTTAQDDVTMRGSVVTQLSADYLNLTDGQISQCLSTNGTVRFTANEGAIHTSSDVCDRTSSNICHIYLDVAPGMVVRFKNLHTCKLFELLIMDTGPTKNRTLVHDTCIFSFFKEMFSFTNSVAISLVCSKATFSAEGYLVLPFAAVHESERPHLELVYLSSTTGYIQTPGWEKEAIISQDMDSWVELIAPANCSVMISFVDVSLNECNMTLFASPVHLEIYQTTTAPKDRVAKICGVLLPSPSVYHVHVLHFHLAVGLSFHYSTGFRLLFSFHNSTMPQKLSSGRWNCSSVSDWTAYQLHFPCNLYPDCVDMKDESLCPYTTEECGPGFFAAEGSCFAIVKASNKEWVEASMLCTSRDLKPGRLKNSQMIESVSKLLETRDKTTLFLTSFIGLRGSKSLSYMYRKAYTWTDGTILFVEAEKVFSEHEVSQCASWAPKYKFIQTHDCERTFPNAYILCERDIASNDDTLSRVQQPEISIPANSHWTVFNFSLVHCPLRHVTHSFLVCDPSSDCWDRGYDTKSCSAPVQRLPPSYRCANGLEHVPYSLVCDHRADCRDSSDEDFCQFDPCGADKPFDCGDGQCLVRGRTCDGQQHCINGADEQCSTPPRNQTFWFPPPRSGVIILDSLAKLTLKPLSFNQTSTNHRLCNETHFLCPEWDVTYCLPVFLRCNGLHDCPGHGDEAACDTYTCPGFYRCRNSRVCVHPSHLCDGLFQCPQHEDELLCDLTCPDTCVCHGFSFFCSRPFPAAAFPSLRFLDATGIGMTAADVQKNRMLIHLSLAGCHLRQLGKLLLPNLCSLDLTDNLLSVLEGEDFAKVSNLREIYLTGNPLSSFLNGADSSGRVFLSVKSLDVSRVILKDLNVSIIRSMFPRLQALNLSSCEVDRVYGEGFRSFTDLRVLDLRGCPMTEFGRDIFTGLSSLESVDAENHKLCCPGNLPQGFNILSCRAPVDETSSCEALLRSDVYRIFLSLTAFSALAGNTASLTYRIFCLKADTDLGFDVFVTSLCLSDLLMGLYLAIIGVADRVYMGVYLWKDLEWRNSEVCKLSGFLALLSSEVSAFIISLITLDRFLVLRFPFSRVYFSRRSAFWACCLAWMLGVLIAGVPLLPATFHWKFYSQSGICIPLPIHHKSFAGHAYSFGVIIVLNFALFLLIAVGQVTIFWSVRANSMAAGDTSRKSKDLTVARRLISVAASNFLCWFPIGLLGLLASNGVLVSDSVNVAMAIFVLPINSALNPFLYTINLLLERRRRAQELRLMQRLKRQMQTSVADVKNSIKTFSQSSK